MRVHWCTSGLLAHPYTHHWSKGSKLGSQAYSNKGPSLNPCVAVILPNHTGVTQMVNELRNAGIATSICLTIFKDE